MRIGILNSGGDCPGLNAVICGAVGAATRLGWEAHTPLIPICFVTPLVTFTLNRKWVFG